MPKTPLQEYCRILIFNNDVWRPFNLRMHLMFYFMPLEQIMHSLFMARPFASYMRHTL